VAPSDGPTGKTLEDELLKEDNVDLNNQPIKEEL